MNLVKRSLKVGGTRGEIGALGEIKASLLTALNLPLWVLASLSCFMGLTGGLTRELYWVVRGLGAIAKDGGLNVILPNGLADPLDIELLEL